MAAFPGAGMYIAMDSACRTSQDQGSTGGGP
jgi:hypothetical protein